MECVCYHTQPRFTIMLTLSPRIPLGAILTRTGFHDLVIGMSPPNMTMTTLLDWLEPWEFYPTLLVVLPLAIGVYAVGVMRRRRAGLHTGFWRNFCFYLGTTLVYAVMQTHLDYLAQHMFWIHRAQHLVLHHLAPFLIMLAAPYEVVAWGLPAGLRTQVLVPLWRRYGLRRAYRVLQNPLLACLLFVGLIYFWLLPSVHFIAMLDLRLYKVMNWSMVLDGLMFWWLMLDPRSRSQGARIGFGTRVLLLFVVMVPQMLLGAYICFVHRDLYSVYAVCGRIWPIDPMTDQQVGGLITWIPSAMMSVLGTLVVLHHWMRNGRETALASVALTETAQRANTTLAGT